ncbi:MAG: ornithine carbamoyltransferase [Planctomycetota bacterium]
MSTPIATVPNDLLSLGDWSKDAVAQVLERAASIKASPNEYATSLEGLHAVMVFEKPSLRTRLSFEIGIAKMGGKTLFYDTGGEQLGQRETVHDYAKVIERYADCVIARVFSQEALKEFADVSQVPVVNALSDLYHPCQALADMLTLREWCAQNRFGVNELRVCYVGEGNNVAHSLMLVCAKMGVPEFTWIGPRGYEPNAAVTDLCERDGMSVKQSQDLAASAGSHAIYTDAWISMGDEHKAEMQRASFRPYTVDAKVMSSAADGAVFMHCLPAHRGEEVTDEVIDSKASLVFDQAENRMWAQNGLLVEMMSR